MDSYLEYIVEAKKTSKNYILVISSVVIGFILTTVSLLFYQLLSTLSLFIIVAVWYGVYWIITGTNSEYEYIVTNGELDIDCIYARRSRKRVLSVNCRDFEICASINDVRFDGNKDIIKVIDVSAKNSTSTYYFADFLLNSKKVRLIFSPTDKMLEDFKRYNPRNVYYS